mmetsp:Transcript_2418/g.6739  ORF Transcript_2418/g.6739 Transcript_2418/m.6739 type:complete len:218 (-) Transcript_2418:675-1328(-)
MDVAQELHVRETHLVAVLDEAIEEVSLQGLPVAHNPQPQERAALPSDVVQQVAQGFVLRGPCPAQLDGHGLARSGAGHLLRVDPQQALHQLLGHLLPGPDVRVATVLQQVHPVRLQLLVRQGQRRRDLVLQVLRAVREVVHGEQPGVEGRDERLGGQRQDPRAPGGPVVQAVPRVERGALPQSQDVEGQQLQRLWEDELAGGGGRRAVLAVGVQDVH